MITPKRRFPRCNITFGDSAPTNYRPILNRHGISYWVSGTNAIVPPSDWILDEYLGQAYDVCGIFGISPGPTPSATSMRLLRASIVAPLGTCHSFSRTIEASGAYAGGRTEVGVYGDTSGEIWDVDFKQAYATQLLEGYGDLAGWGQPIETSDFVDATVSDESEYPILRVKLHGRDFYSKGSTRRLMTVDEFRLTNPITIHQTYTLDRRRDISNMVERLLVLRDSYPVIKLLLNSLVGRLRIESASRVIAVKRPKAGDRYICPGTFAREVPSTPRGALAIAARITGAVRADLTTLLRLSRSAGGTPLCWDTDGATILNYSGAPIGPYTLKRKRCSRAEVWGGKISILTTDDGIEHVRCGGLPGQPNANRLRAIMSHRSRTMVAHDGVLRRLDGTYVGRGVSHTVSGHTSPYRLL